MADYYYYDGGDSVGPYSAEGMQHLLKNLMISPDTLVFDEDRDEWVPFTEIKFEEEKVGLATVKPRKVADSGPIWAVRYQKQIIMGVSVMTMILFSIAAYFFFFTSTPPPLYRGQDGPPEPWASTAKYRWPLMVLSNKAWFKGRAELAGTSAFLFRYKDGKIYAATARHLLSSVGDSSPAVSLREIKTDLIFWFLSPLSARDKKIQVEGLGQAPKEDPDNEWLILKVVQDANLAQAIPLRLRTTPVNVDERVHLVGVPNEGSSPSQNVYTGKVISRSDDRFRFNVYPLSDLKGFNGAPIVDDDGLVVGIMTAGFPSQAPENATLGLCPEAGGQDAATALSMLTP